MQQWHPIPRGSVGRLLGLGAARVIGLPRMRIYHCRQADGFQRPALLHPGREQLPTSSQETEVLRTYCAPASLGLKRNSFLQGRRIIK